MTEPRAQTALEHLQVCFLTCYFMIWNSREREEKKKPLMSL